MKSIEINKPFQNLLRCFLFCLLTFFLSDSIFAQFKIIGMQHKESSGWQTAYEADLTIHEPDKQPHRTSVQYDPSKQYASGTTFTTHANTAISILYKGQTQLVYDNSILKVVIEKNGIKAQTLKGTVGHILKDVKQKVGFYKAGNGYTWAHAEGTQFTVQANKQSKNVKIATAEGKVTIIDKVPVSINQQASTQGGGRNGRELTTTVRTYNGAGQEYVTRQNARTQVYATYQDAINAFEQDTYNREQNGTAYLEELADSYTLIGELYLDIGEFDRAIEPLGKAVQYSYEVDPEDIYIIDTSLYYSEALVNSSDANNKQLGNQLIIDIINILIPELNEYVVEYKYALKYQDEDWAWDLCYDLVDINEFLGWSYELLNNMAKAQEFYNWADEYDSRL